MARHRRAILALQWIVVVFYAVLVVLPAFLPHPNPEARLFSSDFGASSSVAPELCVTPGRMPLMEKAPTVAAWHERLVLLAQYLFWGIWWPFVIISIMFMGRVWCGVLCPEGALAEFASRRGLGWRIPRWLRWGGWPVVAFILTTVYGQLISVYEYPQAALLILGGSTVAAVAIGYVYGKGKRVWCRYLCPVSGVFALLARLAPLHFKVDREAWNRYPQRTYAVDCAPLLNVSRLDGMAECHACGRCSGHRDAVTLNWRSPNAEILQSAAPPAASEAILLLFGILGVAVGAFQWTVSPWFVAAKTAAATWLLDHDMAWALEESPAWWLLTRQPEAQDIFTWLDGLAILAYIGGVALAVGGFSLVCLKLAARLAGADWRRLALGLVPLGGLGLFLGLSMMTVTHLRSEGILLGWLPWVRGALLALAVLWSFRLGFGLLGRPTWLRRGAALAVFAAPVAVVTGLWATLFYVW
ncbi:4Fe-4S binding protein [bacterium]|nr:4Fe-4S binding protein [bacterium]